MELRREIDKAMRNEQVGHRGEGKTIQLRLLDR
jgi:hypothetical protein